MSDDKGVLAIKVKVHDGQHPDLHRVLAAVPNPRLRSGRLKALALAGLQWEKAQAGGLVNVRQANDAAGSVPAPATSNGSPGEAAATQDPLLGVLSWDDNAG